MKKQKNLYLIVTLIIMILILNFGMHTRENVSQNIVSQSSVQQVETKICEFVETAYYYGDNSVEKPEVHMGRVVGIVIVLAVAYLFCILLSIKIGIFFFKTKKDSKESTKDSKYSLQGVRQ